MRVLNRTYRPNHRFSDDELVMLRPIAALQLPPEQPAGKRVLNDRLARLAAVMPRRASGATEGKFAAETYAVMLKQLSEGALQHAVECSLRELHWFPTIKQLLDFAQGYVSRERHAITQARAAIRREAEARAKDAAIAADAAAPPLTDEEIRRMKPDVRALGLKCGALTQEQIDRAFADAPGVETPMTEQTKEFV